MISYRLYQDNRRTSPNRGKWYARAIHAKDAISTKELAKKIEANVSVKHADVVAVLSELSVVMTDFMQNGMKVKLEGIGQFKINLKSTAADTAADFTAVKHIVGSRVNFFPETTIDGNHKRRKAFLDGVRFYETPKNDVDTSSPSTSGSGSGNDADQNGNG